jgi:O-6-methylguanine DNA methyltransferase
LAQVRVKFSRSWRDVGPLRKVELDRSALNIHREIRDDSTQTRIFCASFESPIGVIYIASTEKGLCKIALPRDSKSSFFGWINSNFDTDEIVDDRKKNSSAIRQLNEYFIGKRTKFELDIDLIGTVFQQRVWTEVARTPYGVTVTYKQIARKVRTKGYRSVGASISKNPLPIIIPCHRVVGSDQKLTGYTGGIKLKEYLLRLEGIILV